MKNVYLAGTAKGQKLIALRRGAVITMEEFNQRWEALSAEMSAS